MSKHIVLPLRERVPHYLDGISPTIKDLIRKLQKNRIKGMVFPVKGEGRRQDRE